MYKTAIVAVSGGRANHHAEAYQHITRGELAAISTRQRDNLDQFGERHGVAARYTDYREMFEKEKPDLVHVNTPPNVRLEIFEAAEAAGVPAVLVEKPLAIQAEDYLAIRAFAASKPTSQDRHQSSVAVSSAPSASATLGGRWRDWRPALYRSQFRHEPGVSRHTFPCKRSALSTQAALSRPFSVR